MNKYLSKIASTNEDVKKGDVRFGLAATHAITGYPVFAISHNAAAKPVVSAMYSPSNNVDKRTIRKILKANKDLDITFSKHKATKNTKWDPRDLHMEGASYLHKDHPHLRGRNLNKNYIHAAGVKNMDVLAHEIGHAKAFKNGNFQSPSHKVISRGQISSLAGSVMLSNSDTSKYAWMAPLVGVAPTVYSEGVANYHAHNLIKQHGGKVMANRYLRGIGAKNMLGYSTGAIANSAYLYGLHRLGKHLNKEQ